MLDFLSFYIKISLKSDLGRENVKNAALILASLHNVTKSI